MSRFNSFISLAVLALSVGCTSGPSSGSGNSPLTRMLASGPDPLCVENGTAPFWIANGTTTVQCPTACPDGSHLQCTAVLQEQVQCDANQQIQPLGPTKPGEVISAIGSCPTTPKDCGTNVNGSTWWQNTGTTNTVCDTCPDGTPHNCVVNVQTQYTCNNGVTSSTGKTQNGSIVQYTNECLPDAPCGSRPSGSNWWQITGQQQAVCQTCADGSKITCTYNTESQESCTNGVTAATGQTRQGSLLSQDGQCPAQPPKACGNNPSGSTWWQNSGQTAATTCDVCPDGTPHTCVVNVQNQYSCSDGVTTATGQTQNGSIVKYTNTCPASCGPHVNGSLWWQVAGQSNAVCQTCWDNSKITCIYQDSVQETCNNGAVTSTGQTQHQEIGQVGQCPPQPKNCGDVLNGQTTWQANGQTAPYACGTCLDGSSHLCVSENDVQMMCNNGTLSPTGQTKVGPVIGYTNTCPNVKPVNESYQVPTALPKADVLFVVDATPMMYRTIKSLGERFENLISSWKDVDWQIGIANSDVTPWHVDYLVQPGDLIRLNPYPNDDVKRPLTVLNKNIKWADSIFRRNISFDSLSWSGGGFCFQQPFCSLGPSEPLKQIMLTFQHRSDAADKDFFRADSYFVPIIVSAEDERWRGPENPRATKPAEVVDAFKKSMGDMAGMKAYSIIIKPGDEECMDDYSSIFEEGWGGHYGRYLDQFAKQTGGYSISVCSRHYSKDLSGLSQAVRQQISSIKLQDVPYKGVVKITFTPAISGISWSVNGNQVVFNQPLPPGTTLAISYLVLQP